MDARHGSGISRQRAGASAGSPPSLINPRLANEGYLQRLLTFPVRGRSCVHNPCPQSTSQKEECPMTTATKQGAMRFGYARVSTLDQDEALQLDALKAAGVDRVFTDKASGALESRPALDELLGQLRAGDTVVVWRLDRLGRSLRHLIDVMSDLDRRGVALASLRESIDTSTPGGKLDLPRLRGVGGVRAGPDPGAHHGWAGCCSCPWPSGRTADGVDAGEAAYRPVHV